MIRGAVLCAVFLSAGCATVVPMQTASVVDEAAHRVGAQLSAAAFCNVNDVTECNEYPDGVPLPELRVDARRGLGSGNDVGGSVQVQINAFAPERPLQLGVTADLKREWLRIPTSADRTHIFSAGVLLGGFVAGRAALAPSLSAEAGIPVFYGWQTAGYEFVVGASVSERVTTRREIPTVFETRTGMTLGVYTRAPTRWALQLGYLTEPRTFTNGSLQLQVGWFWDLPS